MQIRTTRFGSLEISAEDVLRFPSGLIGLEDCREWVLLADSENDALGWLQCTSRPEIALPVVSPRRFIPRFQFRVMRSELAPLALSDLRDAQVLSVVGKHDQNVTLNLKAPVVINVTRRIGRQVIANGEQPVQFVLASDPLPLRKSA